MRKLGIAVLALGLTTSILPTPAVAITDEVHDVTPTPVGGGYRTNDCPGIIVWDTGMYDEFISMVGSGVRVGCFVNAINEGGYPPDGRRLADDWISDGQPITHIKTWGSYNLGGYNYHVQNPGSLHGFCVKFYEAQDNPPWCPDGTGSGELAIGRVVYDEYASNFVEYRTTGGMSRTYNYCISLPSTFRPIADTVYWVSVSADFDYVQIGTDVTRWGNRLIPGLGIGACEASLWDTWDTPPTEWNAVSVAADNPYWQSWDGTFVLYSNAIPPSRGACCLGDGSCLVLEESECAAQQGIYMGNETSCDSNPCQPTPVRSTTWGQIKGTFR